MTKLLKSLTGILLLASLVGCGSSKFVKPTISNQKSDSKTYEYLTEVTLTAVTNEKNKTEKEFLVYVPGTKDDISIYENNEVMSYANGVYISVSVNDTYYDEGSFADEVLKYDYEDVLDGSYGVLKTERLSEVVVDEKSDFAYFSVLEIKEHYTGEGESVYRYLAAKEITPEQRITIEIEIEASDCDKLTETVISELEAYYEIDIDFDYNELKKVKDEFNANPPETKLYDAYDFSFQIPFNYQLDYENSDTSEDELAFGPEASAEVKNDNLLVLLLTDEVETISTEELKKMASELYAEEDETSLDVSDSDITVEGKEIVKCVLKNGDEIGVGYFVSYKEFILYFIVRTDSTELSEKSFKTLETAISTLKIED